MNEFKTVQIFLDENNVTAKDMDAIWAYMYGKNHIVKNLTDHDKDWTFLPTHLMKSLIDIYAKVKVIEATG